MKLWKIAFTVLLWVFPWHSPLSASVEQERQTEESMMTMPEDRSPQEEASSFSDLIKRGFSSNLRALVFLNAHYPGHSTQNPKNTFLKLYKYSGELHLRPDFILETPLLSGVFKPRLISYHRWGERDLPTHESATHYRVFVNEWIAQLKPHPSFIVSFGKEKLLWGPSMLSGPSNILFKDTEKTNPFSEVEGKYLAKAVYMPSSSVTVSLMQKIQEEEDKQGNRPKQLNALKIDLMGSDYSLSLIGYQRKGERFRFGGYGQWTASDALVLYYDGIVSRGTDSLFPAEDQAHPLGGEFIRKYDNAGRLFTTVTAGGSYTFLSGTTFSMEFFYNGAGYNAEEAAQYYRLRKNAAGNYSAGGTLSSISGKTLAEALNAGSPFLRQHYVMAQFQKREIRNVMDVMLRYIHNLQENSGQTLTILEWKVTDRLQFFNINTIGTGRRDTEFRSIVSKSFMVGLELHF